MGRPVIHVENLSKAYQIGQIGTGTISRDLERFVTTKILGKEDPDYLASVANLAYVYDTYLKQNEKALYYYQELSAERLVHLSGSYVAPLSTDHRWQLRRPSLRCQALPHRIEVLLNRTRRPGPGPHPTPGNRGPRRNRHDPWPRRQQRRRLHAQHVPARA